MLDGSFLMLGMPTPCGSDTGESALGHKAAPAVPLGPGRALGRVGLRSSLLDLLVRIAAALRED